jgi:hypothetical protein
MEIGALVGGKKGRTVDAIIKSLWSLFMDRQSFLGVPEVKF